MRLFIMYMHIGISSVCPPPLPSLSKTNTQRDERAKNPASLSSFPFPKRRRPGRVRVLENHVGDPSPTLEAFFSFFLFWTPGRSGEGPTPSIILPEI